MILISYAIIAFFFGFNYTMDYFTEQRTNPKTPVFVIIMVGFFFVFPLIAMFWPFILMRKIYNSFRN